MEFLSDFLINSVGGGWKWIVGEILTHNCAGFFSKLEFEFAISLNLK